MVQTKAALGHSLRESWNTAIEMLDEGTGEVHAD